MSIFSGILGLLGGIGNTILGGSMQSDMQEQNKKDSKELMQFQSDLQQQMQNRQNAFYSKQIPIQVQGIKQAGLNPAMMKGSFDSSVMTAPLPSSTMSSAPFPNINALDGIGIMAQSELATKQADYYDSLAKKTESETKGLDINNNYLASNWKAQIINLLSSSQVNKATSALNFSKINEINANVDKITKEIDFIQSNIETNRSNQKYMESMAEYYKKQSSSWNSYINSVIRKNFADANLAYGKNSREQQMLLYDIFNADAMANYYMSQSSLNDMMRKLQDVELKMQKRYGDAQRITGIINNVVGSIGSAVGGAAGAFFGVRRAINGASGSFSDFSRAPISFK